MMLLVKRAKPISSIDHRTKGPRFIRLLVLPVLAPIPGAASGLVGAIFRLTLEQADRSSSPQS